MLAQKVAIVWFQWDPFVSPSSRLYYTILCVCIHCRHKDLFYRTKVWRVVEGRITVATMTDGRHKRRSAQQQKHHSWSFSSAARYEFEFYTVSFANADTFLCVSWAHRSTGVSLLPERNNSRRMMMPIVLWRPVGAHQAYQIFIREPTRKKIFYVQWLRRKSEALND